MEEISASKAKATFLALLKKVDETGKPIRVTKHGKPIVDIVPTNTGRVRSDWVGSMKGEIKILGDIVGPIIDEDEWDDLK
jgi:prevent-host-death family protein